MQRRKSARSTHLSRLMVLIEQTGSAPDHTLEASLEEARRVRQAQVEAIAKARLALDKRSETEEARWSKKKEQLESALRRARSPSHLRLV
jgi:hypothetical protein